MHLENAKVTDYYDARWAEESKAITSEALLRLSRILWGFSYIEQRKNGRVTGAPFRAGRICDLGCGYGLIASHLTGLGDVSGVDYSPGGISTAKLAFPNIHFEVGDATTYRPTIPFDVVVSSEVIEHVPNKEMFVATCSESLVEGGYLILTCPNGRYKHLNAGGTISNQPIEEWPTPGELLRLFRRDFDIVLYDTFRTDYFRHGINRFANSYKVRKFVNAMNFDAAYDSLLGRFNLGLYQFLIAQKKSTNPGRTHP